MKIFLLVFLLFCFSAHSQQSDPIQVLKDNIVNPKDKLKNEINKNLNEQTNKNLKEFFTTVKTNISLNEYDQLEGSIIGFKPMLPYDNKSDDIYGWQTSLAITDSRYTLNNGFVYRRLNSSLDYPLIYGANLFYDIEFPDLEIQYRKINLHHKLMDNPKKNLIFCKQNHYLGYILNL